MFSNPKIILQFSDSPKFSREAIAPCPHATMPLLAERIFLLYVIVLLILCSLASIASHIAKGDLISLIEPLLPVV